MKKIKSIVFWAGICLLILVTILSKPLSNLDEMWNFNVARCISNGLIPYKDISMVTTPFLGFTTAIFLKIFGTEMFVTRILAAILAVVNVILIYRIFVNLKVNKVISKTSVAVIVMSLLDYFCLDYNFLALTFALALILIEIKLQKKNCIHLHVIAGIMAGIAICTKQSIGFLLSIFVVLNTLFYVRNKSDWNITLKNIMYRVIGIMVPLLIFVIYMLCTKSFEFFIDYAVLGIKTFSNKIEYSNLVKSDVLAVSFLAIIVPVFIFTAIVENVYFKFIKKEKRNLYILTVYSIPMFAMVYPIADNIHFLIASVVPIILGIYSLYKVICKAPKVKFEDSVFKYALDILNIVITLFIVVYLAYFEITNMDRLSNLSKYTKLDNFKYIYVDAKMKSVIDETDKYITSQEKNVYILDATSAIYMIPINKYNKDYDMFNKGNLGVGSEQKQIDRIKEEDAKYLILKEDYSLNWQTPIDVITYVRDNLKYTESIGCFDVYENYKEDNKEEPKQESTEKAQENSNSTENTEHKEESAEQ